MDIEIDVHDKLASAASISNQKDRVTAYLTLLDHLLTSYILTRNTTDLIAFGRHFTTSTSMAMVVGRRVLGNYVTALCAGSGLVRPSSSAATTTAASGGTVDGEEMAQDVKWEKLGAEAFKGESGEEGRRTVLEGVLSGETSGWCDEQTTILRHLQAHILENEEDWLGAARALMQIPLEGGSRLMQDEEKLSVYIKIVRLLLECEEWGQAQTYFSRASLFIHNCKDKETLLNYRLSQARLFDFSGRLNEAAQRYHEVSFDSAIDENDRIMMLQAAVTTSILAPAGPQRSRILASLNRDDRIHTSLPPHLSNMLRKMLLEYIVRPQEVEEFARGLAPHQRATVEGGGTVLERAVREHNVGACGKVYDNISFDGLGALLGLDADDAEVIARKMIEQGRLRAWIDQPLHLLYFESRNQHDTDADAQGTAGGLGVEKEEKEVEPVRWTERWNDRIRSISIKVESVAEAILAKGLVPSNA